MRMIRFAALFAAIAGASLSLNVATAGAQVPTSEAAAFVGEWDVAVDAEGQTFTMELDIADADGNLAAEVSAQGSSTKVEKITKSGENLVLSYEMNAQGQFFPIVMTLTPDGEALAAKIDVGGGMFVANGKGTKD